MTVTGRHAGGHGCILWRASLALGGERSHMIRDGYGLLPTGYSAAARAPGRNAVSWNMRVAALELFFGLRLSEHLFQLPTLFSEHEAEVQ